MLSYKSKFPNIMENTKASNNDQDKQGDPKDSGEVFFTKEPHTSKESYNLKMKTKVIGWKHTIKKELENIQNGYKCSKPIPRMTKLLFLMSKLKSGFQALSKLLKDILFKHKGAI